MSISTDQHMRVELRRDGKFEIKLGRDTVYVKSRQEAIRMADWIYDLANMRDRVNIKDVEYIRADMDVSKSLPCPVCCLRVPNFLDKKMTCPNCEKTYTRYDILAALQVDLYAFTELIPERKEEIYNQAYRALLSQEICDHNT